MSPSTPPQVECERHHTTLNVSDVLAAVDFYTNKLGFRLGFTWGGIASPPPKSQLRCIQKLKAKHGIDYDSHASYRFVERV